MKDQEAFINWLINGKLIEMLQRQYVTPAEQLSIYVTETNYEDSPTHFNYYFSKPISLTQYVGGQVPKIVLPNGHIRREDVETVTYFLVQSLELAPSDAERVVSSLL